MKKLKIAILTGVISVSLMFVYQHTEAEAATHTVQSGDTYWKLSNQYGVSIQEIKSANKQTSNLLYVGQKLYIPQVAISAMEKDLMARLVSAEAKGEPYAGKVAVATVILNRLSSPDFPNTIKEVIYQIDGGHYAFTPVQNGAINSQADADSKRAVDEALSFWGQGRGSLYFYNPKTSSSKWILSREVTVKIGNHVFAK
jgi:N-acetylmuramoyl-L-alanine amidase|nr:cell wall hydrolase [uncultured Bacillus sp.]